jgi:hypothetical protein
LSAGLTRLPTGLRVKTHIKAGPQGNLRQMRRLPSLKYRCGGRCAENSGRPNPSPACPPACA